MPNKCEGCPRNCCFNFKLTQELVNPQAIKEILSKFPYIKKIGESLVIGPNGNEAVVGVYNCERFDPQLKICKNYGKEPRPDFCTLTGESFYPHEECLLKPK